MSDLASNGTIPPPLCSGFNRCDIGLYVIMLQINELYRSCWRYGDWGKEWIELAKQLDRYKSRTAKPPINLNTDADIIGGRVGSCRIGGACVRCSLSISSEVASVSGKKNDVRQHILRKHDLGEHLFHVVHFEEPESGLVVPESLMRRVEIAIAECPEDASGREHIAILHGGLQRFPRGDELLEEEVRFGLEGRGRAEMDAPSPYHLSGLCTLSRLVPVS